MRPDAETRIGSPRLRLDPCQGRSAAVFLDWIHSSRRRRGVHFVPVPPFASARHAVNLSGILVRVAPDLLADLTARLQALPGVEVRQVDAASGRVVVLQEAPTVEDEVAGLTRIKALSGVVAAEMIYHYFAEDPALAATSAAVARQGPAGD